jgi:hypothetical protein
VRNPYKTGGWVSGPDHYGRQALLAHILESDNDAVWVVGNRRMGKTSLLRQLEFLTADNPTYVPLYWDMQGSTTMQELTAELIYAIEDEEKRFRNLLGDFGSLQDKDAIGILRLLRRNARSANKRLLLLCDEAEALLKLAENESDSLARLRRVFQSANGLRVVLTSTKVLSRINALNAQWETSPFLFGFGLRNLTRLDDESTRALIQQSQDPVSVEVSTDQAAQIADLTGNHPLLTQILCSRLFQDTGVLRPLTQEDLSLDAQLKDFFQNDFRWLSPGERQVLLSITTGQRTVEAIAQDTGLAIAAVQDFVYSQERLAQIRQTEAGLAPGNEFLRRWLQQNHALLDAIAHISEVPDDTTLQLVQKGQMEEAPYLIEQIRIYRNNLHELDLQRAQFGLRVPMDLINEINHTRIELDKAYQRLAFISPEILESISDNGTKSPNVDAVQPQFL